MEQMQKYQKQQDAVLTESYKSEKKKEWKRKDILIVSEGGIPAKKYSNSSFWLSSNLQE